MANLAYYFTFSYRDARQPERYTEDLAEAILQWRSAHNTSCLFFEDLGSTLIVWICDLLLHTLTELTGVDKDIYVRCGRASSRAGLREAFPALNEAGIDASLQRLLEARLIVYFDGIGTSHSRSTSKSTSREVSSMRPGSGARNKR